VNGETNAGGLEWFGEVGGSAPESVGAFDEELFGCGVEGGAFDAAGPLVLR